MHEFPGPHERIHRILGNAFVAGCTYVSSRPEDGGKTFVIEARRPDGRGVGVRFRGLRDPDAGSEGRPEAGTSLRVRSVKGEGPSLLGRVFPILRSAPAYARVRIDAGPATLDIVCQDAEWWEE